MKNKKTSRNIWYLLGTAIGLAVIAFIITFTFYTNKIEDQIQQAQLDNKKISEIVQSTETESASTQMGKTVEESAKEQNNKVNVVTNEANSENSTNKDNTNVATTTNKNTTKTNTENQNNKTAKDNDTTKNSKANTKKEISFIKPVEGEILKGFAKDTLLYSETLGEWTTHLGIDIKAEKTAIVKASESGKVKSIKNDPRYGLSIIIEHDDGYETLYSNLLSSEFVKVGEQVQKGQSIGTVGNTATFEIADQPHLHFEITKDGVQQDPGLVIK